MTRRIFQISCIVLALCALAVQSVHAQAKWDQDRVSAIADQLPGATESLYTALYKESAVLGPRGGDTEYYEFRDRVRLMHTEARHFAGALDKGEGRKETFHSFERLGELNRDSIVYARRQFAVDPVLEKFAAVEDLLRQLHPYYFKPKQE